jgi:ATP-binding cassette subfamily G (WHITE) protein 2
LDSVNAFKVMRCLYNLAHEKGKTIIFAIHSPDSALFQLFTNVLILAKGHLVYSGHRDNLLGRMEAISKSPCPAQFNPADFAIHVVAKVAPEDLERIASEAGGGGNPSASSEISEKGAPADFNSGGVELEEMVDRDRRESVLILEDEHKVVREDGVVASTEESDSLGSYNQSWLWQTLYIMKRNMQDSWRNPYLLRLQYILILGAALVLGGMFFQLDNTLAGAQNRAGFLFFTCTLLMIVTLPSIDTFYSERALFLRERGGGYYSASSYFVAKALSDVLPLRLVPPILFTCIAYPMVGLRWPADHFFWFMLITILLSFCATGMCLLISSLSPSVSVGNLVAILVMLFMLLFGGLLLNQATLPPGLQWIRWLSFINYAFSAMMVNEFVNQIFFITAFDEVYPIAGQYFVVSIFGLDAQYFYLNIYLLVVFGVLFYAASGVVLYFVKEKR